MMNLRTCDTLLLVAGAFTLASGIQLEAAPDGPSAWVWLHMALGAAMTVLVCIHLALRYRRRNWLAAIWRQPRALTRWLSATALLALLSGIAATAEWIAHGCHTGLGGFHGKVAFLFMALAIWHTVTHARFYYPGRSRRK